MNNNRNKTTTTTKIETERTAMNHGISLGFILQDLHFALSCRTFCNPYIYSRRFGKSFRYKARDVHGYGYSHRLKTILSELFPAAHYIVSYHVNV